MKRTEPVIKGGRAVENLYRLQLMAVLRGLVRDRGGYRVGGSIGGWRDRSGGTSPCGRRRPSWGFQGLRRLSSSLLPDCPREYYIEEGHVPFT